MRYLFLLFISFTLFAESIYVGQSSAGADNGNDAANRHSMIWLNTSGNWGVGAGKVSAGDTVHLVGTMTTPFVCQGGGSVGNPVTILFDSGAKFSNTTWPTAAGVMDISDFTYVIIDGGTDGKIEATANGSSLANQVLFNGIQLNGAANCEIKNLIITNLYIHTEGNTDGGCNGISIDKESSSNSSNLSIHNNYISWSDAGVYWTYNSGASNASVYSNTFRYINSGVIFGGKNSGSTFTTVLIYNNNFSDAYVWDDNTPANNFHHEAVHYWCYNTTVSAVSGVKVYGNYAFGNWGLRQTASLFFEGTSLNIAVFNNVLNGCTRNIYTKMDTSTHFISNNTLLGTGFSTDTLTGCIVTWQNNIAWGTSGPGYNGSAGRGPLVNANHNLEEVDPVFVGGTNYHLQASSPAIGAGSSTGLTGYYTTDKDGVTWTNPWGIGAYQFVSSAPTRNVSAQAVRANTATVGN